jgi:hypothetical protein
MPPAVAVVRRIMPTAAVHVHIGEGLHLSLPLLSSFACNGGALSFSCVCTVRDPRRGSRCKAHRFSACDIH